MTPRFLLLRILVGLMLPPIPAAAGVASWYQSGTVTANGEKFNADADTCASRSHPFGTVLKVTHGSRSVVVRVNDRISKRYAHRLDLSRGAFAKLAPLDTGLIAVTVEPIE